jgi:HlyD family secretion protein
MKKKILPILLVLAVGLSYLAWRAWGQKPFLYAGTVEATEVDVPSRLGTLIESYQVKEGETVSEGQTLVTLTGEDFKLAAELAEGDLRRALPLYRSGSLPKEQYDHLRIKREDAALKNSWRAVRSPIAGTVLTTYHEPGEWAAPGTKLLTLADLREVWVRVYVPETLLHALSQGLPVKATAPETGDRTFQGTVTHINDQAEFTPKNVQTRKERSRLVYGVKVTFPNADRALKPGMTLEVELPNENK